MKNLTSSATPAVKPREDEPGEFLTSQHLTAIGFETDELRQQAQIIADDFHFVIDNQVLPRLSVTADKLVLLTEDFSPLFVDFNSVSVQKRRDEGKKQGLVRACKPIKGMRILDVTAGWGRDAAVLASFGAEVLMLERQPIMAALLSDGLNRLSSDVSFMLSLQHVDAKHYLQTLPKAEYPDVIYIDPMHPARQKAALVKKDMQILQRLIGEDDDVNALIQLAILRTRQRVVVKWPQRLPALLKPDASVTGKTVRFDIYTSKSV